MVRSVIGQSVGLMVSMIVPVGKRYFCVQAGLSLPEASGITRITGSVMMS
jgi:hypothetical protein